MKAENAGLEKKMTPSYRRPGQNRAAKPLVMAVQVILKCLPILVLTVCGPFMASAGYKDDIGYTALQSALGANMPDGRGVAVCQVEAVNNQSWMPDTGYSQFSGKTISDRTGNCPGTSPHATTVGTYFYGSDQSIAPAVTAINVYEATDWLLDGFLHLGSLLNGKPIQPVYDTTQPWTLSAPSRIANHSWVGSAAGNPGFLRRMDFVIASDHFIQVAAVNIGTTPRPLFSSAYNAITVGRTDGLHPTGTAAVDAVYTAGRTCPLIVAPLSPPSYTTPVVAAAAALLVQTGRRPELSSDPLGDSQTNRSGNSVFHAENAEVIKAALLAGAQRVTRNASGAQIADYRRDPGHRSANGLDTRFGAGQLQIGNSYAIITAGEQNSAEDLPSGNGMIDTAGFDYDPAFGGLRAGNTTGTYYFSPDKDHCRLYAALVWNIDVDGGAWNDFDDTVRLYHLKLALHDITAPETPRLVAAAASTQDNTQNLWSALVPGRRYRLRVSPATGQAPFLWDYALAWRMQTPPDSDGDGIPDDWEVEFGLDPGQAGDAAADPDKDGLDQAGEYRAGTEPSNPDSDGDGRTDGTEIRAGSDPLDPNDKVATVPALYGLWLVAAAGILTAVGGVLFLKQRKAA